MLAFALLLLLGMASAEAESDPYAQSRTALIEEIESDVRATSHYIGTGELDPRVMNVMATTPRHEFVPAEHRAAAYANRPLPIGHGQTISQPYIVALMTHLLDVGAESRVLEVGTGSGYQAAILAGLCKSVDTMEIVAPLAQSARQRLARLGYRNVTVRHGDGYYGWKEHAPYDVIIVTAAPSHVPPPLIEQLKAGGRMVIPIGSRFTIQQLLLIEKAQDGSLTTRQVLPVRFVPLTGDHD